MIGNISNAAAEQELRELVAERVAAVHTRAAATWPSGPPMT